MVGKAERIRDPVHDLIVFREEDETDQIAWKLINTPEFQRLRRIRQLGFSDLVYPGATHSRLAHSIGVYHLARRLVRTISRKIPLSSRNRDRERTVLLGALLHDVGHGPFSHAFEHAAKGRSHVEWSAEIITGDTEIHSILKKVDAKLPDEIARLLREEQAKDIYATVVSSQFDGDRLDYLQRDRLMSGVEFGHLDIEWIFDSIEVGEVTVGSQDDPVTEPCLYLNPKGIQVAEEYLEARFRMYMVVYMHKTTRGAELLLQSLLRELRDVAIDDAELRSSSRLAAFMISNPPSLSDYLLLDDAVVWAEFGLLSRSKHAKLAEFAQRILQRRLYKCFDLGAAAGENEMGNRRRRFMRVVKERQRNGEFPNLLIDDATVAGYKWYDFEGDSALERVWVKRDRSEAEPRDIAEFSSIVQSLINSAHVHRLYVPSKGEVERLVALFKGIPS